MLRTKAATKAEVESFVCTIAKALALPMGQRRTVICVCKSKKWPYKENREYEERSDIMSGSEHDVA